MFFNRRVSARNSLPSFIVNSKSVASFKRSLVSFDLSEFLVYADKFAIIVRVLFYMLI